MAASLSTPAPTAPRCLPLASMLTTCRSCTRQTSTRTARQWIRPPSSPASSFSCVRTGMWSTR
eukprot:2457504-Prymnesium_polylepis.1